MPRGQPIHGKNGLVAKRPPAPKAPPRAGFGPHCKVLRTGNPAAPAFVPVFCGRQGPNCTSEAQARAWLAIADVCGPRFQGAK